MKLANPKKEFATCLEIIAWMSVSEKQMEKQKGHYVDTEVLTTATREEIWIIMKLNATFTRLALRHFFCFMEAIYEIGLLGHGKS